MCLKVGELSLQRDCHCWLAHSHTGCHPGEHSSGGQCLVGGIDRLGDGWTRCLLVEAPGAFGSGSRENGHFGWANPLQGREAPESMNHPGSPPNQRGRVVIHWLAFVCRTEFRWGSEFSLPIPYAHGGHTLTLFRWAYPLQIVSKGTGVRGWQRPGALVADG